MTVDARSCAGTSRSEPPNPPTGVRSGSQMTASRTVLLLVLGISARTGACGTRRRVCTGAPRGARVARWSGGAGADLHLGGVEERPQAGDLERPDDGAGSREDLHADALGSSLSVCRGE